MRITHSLVLCFLIFCSVFAAHSSFAQFTTGNQFIVGNIDAPSAGLVTVLLPPGRITTDRQLSFDQHSYLTCMISGQLYTNNDRVALPPNGHLLTGGITAKNADTITTTWKNLNGVDIIQDIYPVAFTKSGQIVFRFKFNNHNANLVPVACQYLLDIQISDPTVSATAGHPNSDDGPWILTRWDYNGNWRSYPGINPLPWFYCAFLYRLPNAPTYQPGLSAQGYTDYAPLGLIPPDRMTIGDWVLMINYPWGSSGMPSGVIQNKDCAVLLEFPPRNAEANKITEVGRTSYGTGEFETCLGDQFGLVFYPHHLKWTPLGTSGYYTPNPFDVQFYLFNTNQFDAASNSKVALTVGKNLHIYDSVNHVVLPTTSQVQPSTGPGLLIGPGQVGIPSFQWFVKADPAEFCTGDVRDTLIFSGTSSLGSFSFRQPSKFGYECDHDIIVDCTEKDKDPPIFSDKPDTNILVKNTDVHDDRPTDRGLRKITWHPSGKKDSANAKKFLISYSPQIRPCASDKDIHTIEIVQTDSTVGACFDFTFEDCVGNKSYETICLKAHPLIIIPDRLPPEYHEVELIGSFDSSVCNSRIDSFDVTDDRPHDRGLDTVFVLGVTARNMTCHVTPFPKCSPLARIAVRVTDSMQDGQICIRSIDCVRNYRDTCIYYCTIPDTLAPVVTITKDSLRRGKWRVDVTETKPWDRLIDTIYVLNLVNVNFLPDTVPPPRSLTSGQQVYSFSVNTIDTFKISSFCVSAKDLAKNISTIICGFQDIDTDSHCPNIVISPDPRINPTSVFVSVNDIHFNDYPVNSDTNIWDTGVDKVWFTNISGIIAPDTIYGNCAKEIPPFLLSVIDTLKVDTLSCVTINARDCHGNTCLATWCYPYIGDSLPPLLAGHYVGRDSETFEVTDERIYDRGLAKIETLNPTNLTTFDTSAQTTGLYIKQFGLKRPISGQSSLGTVHALDFWGQQTHLPGHDAFVTFPVWIQDLAMKNSILLRGESSFFVPVYFVKNDTFAVSVKGITDFTFGFTISGDVDYIRFDSVSTARTATANWNVQAAAAGNHVQISGTMKPGANSLSADFSGNLPDSVVLLYFTSLKSTTTHNATLTPDSVIFNNGKDTLYTGLNATALMPPPWGSITGTDIIIPGTCTPNLLSGTLFPLAVSLEQNHPNPFSQITTFDYTLAEESSVRLAIFDLLGKEIVTLVEKIQKQGGYSINFDGSAYPAGTYIARLEAGRATVSRRITLEK
jgi:hypothetical protein